ncbi:MAG: diguanylate cyclase response regulator, partial [Deltaproteobacteria bacterium]
MKVLIAEDEPISRRILQKHVEEYGFEVIPTEDGEEAWEAFQSQREEIQMAIIDWMMPKMDG